MLHAWSAPVSRNRVNANNAKGEQMSPVERCTNDQYQRCLGSLESVAKGEDITLVTSKRELHHVCRKLKRVVDCVDEHTAQCFDATLQRLFNQVVAGAKETIAEVCLPGDTQEDFLRHARCNRNVTLDEEKCAPAYRRTLELAKTVSQAQDVDHGLKRSCCAFSEFVECKNFHVERDCGDRASAFFSRHMQRISGPLIEDHCGHYAHGGSCDDSAASSADRETKARRRLPLLLAAALTAMALKSIGAGRC
ncbi:hypothetical protein HPB52_015291 [Rhipicephalus sanguineus]|uniref:Uncharacterized protein n=1 Tax=Rhipicephalus sanguineus TaxID=34632 RepID=A0A9D4PWN6_RHISA|nr:hypothetical protein HPB52_015291 [Rhipicephalus sanguineus]